MSDPQERADSSTESHSGAHLFSGSNPEPARRGFFFGTTIAIVLVAALTIGLLVRANREAGRLPQNAQLPADAYSRNLVFTHLAMSQSTSLSGGTSTFLDGHVQNLGADTVVGVTLQAVFRNDLGLAPQVDTLPLFLVRTHEPYIDTEPVSAAPLKPGDEMEFRLIFETRPANWNQQMPELTVVRVQKR